MSVQECDEEISINKSKTKTRINVNFDSDSALTARPTPPHEPPPGRRNPDLPLIPRAAKMHMAKQSLSTG